MFEINLYINNDPCIGFELEEKDFLGLQSGLPYIINIFNENMDFIVERFEEAIEMDSCLNYEITYNDKRAYKVDFDTKEGAKIFSDRVMIETMVTVSSMLLGYAIHTEIEEKENKNVEV